MKRKTLSSLIAALGLVGFAAVAEAHGPDSHDAWHRREEAQQRARAEQDQRDRERLRQLAWEREHNRDAERRRIAENEARQRRLEELRRIEARRRAIAQHRAYHIRYGVTHCDHPELHVTTYAQG